MTHKEAIEELKKIDTLSLPDGYLGKMDEALKMAIEALQTEPCEDCISRQAAIDTAIEAADKWDGGFSVERSRIITEALNELPSVQQEPFINKPCISEGVCHEDKMKVLEKIKAEMLDIMIRTYQEVKAIIDKYTAESEDEK